MLIVVPFCARRTDHFYPAEDWLLSKDKAWMSFYTKNFFVGELDWTNAVRPCSPLPAWTAPIVHR